MKNFKIILASGSPRRKELLEDLGADFRVASLFEVDETVNSTIDIEHVAPYLSRRKSRAYKKPIADGEVLLTADTVVILDEQIMGKPKDRDDAFDMLSKLNGRTHRVITGITLRTNSEQRTVSTTTEVKFRKLKDEQLWWYIDTYKPFDKAGSYGAQEWIGLAAIEWFNGQYTNVVGLPTTTLMEELERL